MEQRGAAPIHPLSGPAPAARRRRSDAATAPRGACAEMARDWRAAHGGRPRRTPEKFARAAPAAASAAARQRRRLAPVGGEWAAETDRARRARADPRVARAVAAAVPDQLPLRAHRRSKPTSPARWTRPATRSPPPTTSSCWAPTAARRTARNPARKRAGPGRSDTILLIRTGGGHSARLSIPRDTVVQIPTGTGLQKINAAHAFGGAARVGGSDQAAGSGSRSTTSSKSTSKTSRS